MEDIEKKNNISELAEALSKAQSEIQDAEKNATNPHFKSAYANLTAVLQATREPLSKYGLSVSQSINSEGEEYFIETKLMHKSGQYISSKLKLILNRKDMQELGKAITYARRYSIAAIVGIAQEDTDAEPSDREESKEFKPQTNFQKTYKPTNKPTNLGDVVYPYGSDKNKKLSEIGKVNLYKSLQWLKTARKDQDQVLISQIEEYIKSNEQPINDQIPMPPLPEFDPNEQIPF